MWIAVSGFLVMGLVSGLSLANHSDSGSFLVVQALFSQNGFQWGGFWEVDRTCDVFFWAFPNYSCWWWLVSYLFLIRTSCHKITQANDYYGTWPWWAVSVSMFPLTVGLLTQCPEKFKWSPEKKNSLSLWLKLWRILKWEDSIYHSDWETSKKKEKKKNMHDY